MPRKPLHVVGAATVDGGRCLVARRGPAMAEPGKWEFPGGKVEPGETPREALARELREELGLEVEVGRLLGRGTGRIDGLTLRLDVYLAVLRRGRPVPHEHDAVVWAGPEELARLEWAAADVPVVARLLAHLAGDER